MSDANPSSSSDDLQRDYYAPAVNPPYEAPRPRTPSIDLRDVSLRPSGWLRPLNDAGWAEIILRVGLAGGLFPLVVVCAYSTFAMVVTQGEAFPMAMVAGVFALIVGFPFGTLYAMVACGVVAISVSIAYRVRNIKASWERAGAVTGGLTAMLCMFPFLLMARNFQIGSWDAATDLMVAIAVTAIALFMGMTGGALGGIENLSREQGRSVPVLLDHSFAWRFSTRQLLAVTLLLSIALTVLQVLGLLTPNVLTMLSAWLAVIFLGRGLAIRTALWWRKRRVGKAGIQTNHASSST